MHNIFLCSTNDHFQCTEYFIHSIADFERCFDHKLQVKKFQEKILFIVTETMDVMKFLVCSLCLLGFLIYFNDLMSEYFNYKTNIESHIGTGPKYEYLIEKRKYKFEVLRELIFIDSPKGIKLEYDDQGQVVVSKNISYHNRLSVRFINLPSYMSILIKLNQQLITSVQNGIYRLSTHYLRTAPYDTNCIVRTLNGSVVSMMVMNNI